MSACERALIRLEAEVSGLLGNWEAEIRALAGNTNVAVLKLRVSEAQTAIDAAIKAPPECPRCGSPMRAAEWQCPECGPEP